MECKGCGKCCNYTGYPNLDAPVSEEDRIPKELIEFRKGFGDVERWWMKRRENGDCVALNPITRECDIHEIRPIGCREFHAYFHPICIELNK